MNDKKTRPKRMLSPKCWAQPPYNVLLYPLYGSVLHLIEEDLGLLVGLLVVLYIFVSYI